MFIGIIKLCWQVSTMKKETAGSNRRSSRSEATQSRIISVAKSAFAKEGYADVSLSEIVRQADVTTGAVYHHFKDKKGLFRAVAEALEQEIMQYVTGLPPCDDPWETFIQGIGATLEICARPDINRIVFKEAPSVIGPVEWREIEVQYAFGVMRATITQLADAGIMDAPDPDLTSQIILGSIIEASHAVASAPDAEIALQDAKSAILKMVIALRNTRR